MAQTMAALFDNHTDAYRAVEDLLAHEFARGDISVMTHADTNGASQGTVDASPHGLVQGTRIGAALGGLSGLMIGLLALMVPGIGPVIAAGPLAAVLLATGIGAAVGSMIGALADLGIPAERASYYNEGIRRGGVLVTVATPEEQAEDAVALLSRHHPIDLSRRTEE